jgi:hypothetical protein
LRVSNRPGRILIRYAHWVDLTKGRIKYVKGWRCEFHSRGRPTDFAVIPERPLPGTDPPVVITFGQNHPCSGAGPFTRPAFGRQRQARGVTPARLPDSRVQRPRLRCGVLSQDNSNGSPARPRPAPTTQRRRRLVIRGLRDDLGPIAGESKTARRIGRNHFVVGQEIRKMDAPGITDQPDLSFSSAYNDSSIIRSSS